MPKVRFYTEHQLAEWARNRKALLRMAGEVTEAEWLKICRLKKAVRSGWRKSRRRAVA